MEQPQSPGAGASLRSLAATVLEAIGTRAELAVVELREAGERRKEMVSLALAGLVFLNAGLVLAALFVVALFWDTHRLAAIGAMALLYLGICAWAFARMRAAQRSAPELFEATLRELKADRDLLRGRDG